MTHDDLGSVITYLENYASDLGFQLSHGTEFISYCTDATPEFADDDEAETYIARIESLITELKATHASYFENP